MRLVSVKCPECRARLSLPDGATQVTCEFCGTTSQAQRRTRILERAVAPAPVAGGASRPPMPVATQVHSNLWVLLIVLAPIILGIVFWTVSLARNVPLSEKYGWNSTMIMLHDVNGDGTEDVIGNIHYVHADPRRVHIAAFDGTNGERLWLSPALAEVDDSQAFLTLAGDTVVFATQEAKLTGWSVKDGSAMWKSSLPEVPKQPCSGEGGSIEYITADKARHAVDPATGTVTPAQPSTNCAPIVTDQRDSAGPDAIAPRTDDADPRRPSDIEGMSVDKLVLPLQGDLDFAFGRRRKGTAVPMITAFRGSMVDGQPAREVVWQLEVPETNPLSAYATNPVMVTVDDQFVVVVYDMKKGPHRLAAFQRADGKRLWDVLLDEEIDWFFGMDTTKDLVYLSDSMRLDAFSLADGSHVRTIAMPVY